MNPVLKQLDVYPFERKRQLFENRQTKANHTIDCSIGEPRFGAPQRAIEIAQFNLAQSAVKYSGTKEIPELTRAIQIWGKDKKINLDSSQILALSGSGEGIFSLPSVLISKNESAKVLMPNPGYQVYFGGTLLAGAKPVFYDVSAHNNFQPDFDLWKFHAKQSRLAFINFPSNPTAKDATDETLEKAVKFAYDTRIVLGSDECYFDLSNNPKSVLQVANEMGIKEYKNIIAFHSLSKRSALPGFRSGFMAGDSNIIDKYLRIRMMERKTIPLNIQKASSWAWQDETHVQDSWKNYSRMISKFQDEIQKNKWTDVHVGSTFYVWAKSPKHITSEDFALNLFDDFGIISMPGSYLANNMGTKHPCQGYVRIALVQGEKSTQTIIDAFNKLL